MTNTELGYSHQSDYRESLIGSVLSKQSGIYGAEVCQVCGQIRAFRTWAGAMASHRFRVFCCLACLRGRGEEGAASVLGARARGFCEVCRTAGAARLEPGHHFLCRRCRLEIEGRHPGTPLRDVVHRLVRRRYLETRATATLETLNLNSEGDALHGAEEAARERQGRERRERAARRLLAERHAPHAGGTRPDTA